MRKTVLTRNAWKQFSTQCVAGEKTDQQLFELCVEYFPFDGNLIQKNAEKLLEAIKHRYIAQNIDITDVKSFLSQHWLKWKGSHYTANTPLPTLQIATPDSYATYRTIQMIKEAGDQANDIFGEAYVQEFLHHFKS